MGRCWLRWRWSFWAWARTVFQKSKSRNQSIGIWGAGNGRKRPQLNNGKNPERKCAQPRAECGAGVVRGKGHRAYEHGRDCGRFGGKQGDNLQTLAGGQGAAAD